MGKGHTGLTSCSLNNQSHTYIQHTHTQINQRNHQCQWLDPAGGLWKQWDLSGWGPDFQTSPPGLSHQSGWHQPVDHCVVQLSQTLLLQKNEIIMEVALRGVVWKKDTHSHCNMKGYLISYLVLWLWAQSTTKDYVRAERNFDLSPIYSAHKSSNHKFSKTHKISPDTNSHKTYTNIKHKIFELVPLVLLLLKKAHKARTCWYHGPFHWFIITTFLKHKKKRERTEAIKIFLYYINEK